MRMSFMVSAGRLHAFCGLSSQRDKGEMINMTGANPENMPTVIYSIEKRELLDIKKTLMTATRGTAVMNYDVIGYKKFAGDLGKRDKGSLVVQESGSASTYGLEEGQDKGKCIISPSEKVYKNQICCNHERTGALSVNIFKVKALTNYRSVRREIKCGMQGIIEF